MAYIGNTVENQGFTPAIDYFNGNGVTVTFTLSRPIASVAQVIVAVDNVIQNPNSSFTVAGNAITFSSAPLSGTNNIWVEYTSLITTYQGISQDPTVIGDIRATGGYLAEGDFGNSFVDGTIVDYVTGNGRITVGDADGLTIYNGGTAGRTALMTVGATGNVGIGTSSVGIFGQSAGKLLNVVASSNYAFLQLQGTSGNGGAIDFGDTSVRHAEIASLSGSALAFYTNATNSGNALTERMRITSAGNVGIGTSSPATKAEISGTAAASNLALRITNTATDGYSTIQMGDANAGVYRNGSAQSGYAGASSLNLITVGAHNIGFSTQNTLRATITSDGLLQFNSGYGSVATAYGCRAWVNFNGTGTVAIRASGNVSSITDNGTGSYTVNFTTAMPDVNYSVAGGAGTSTGGNGYRWLAVGSSQASDFSMTTTSVRVQTTYDGTNKTDAEFVGVAIFR